MNHIAYTLLEQSGNHVIARENDFNSEIHRLEHKINLVIQMLGQMLQSQQARPQAVALRLGAETIAWQAPEVKIGQHFIVTLFLYESVALPIQAHVEVIDKDADWCVTRFVSQPPDEQSAWERWVFRQHRRQIATSKEHISSSI